MAARVHGMPMTPWPLALILGLSASALWLRMAAHPARGIASLSTDTAIFGLFLASATAIYLTTSERRDAWQSARAAARL
jgi:hypothetical protein